LAAIVSMALWVGGCATAIVDVTEQGDLTLPKPDMIIVHNFAVTPNDVKLDRGVMATFVRDAQNRKQTDEEVRVGRMVADRVVEDLIDRLEKQGIMAFRASSGVTPSNTTAIIEGEILTVDEGSQTERVWLGFGLGGSELRTRGQMYQGGKLIAKGETRTTPSLKPGMAASVATGTVLGTVGTSVVVGASASGFSEAFLAGVDADASRTADAIAKNIHAYYVKRGWLTN
jgi:hypothetical protein